MKGKEGKMGRELVKEAVGVSKRGKKRRKRETERGSKGKEKGTTLAKQ